MIFFKIIFLLSNYAYLKSCLAYRFSQCADIFLFSFLENKGETKWSQYDNIAVVTIDSTSLISQLSVSNEEFCIASCHR